MLGWAFAAANLAWTGLGLSKCIDGMEVSGTKNTISFFERTAVNYRKQKKLQLL